MFEKTRNFFHSLGLPPSDDYQLSPSNKKFPDGADFRVEVPTINSLEAAKELLSLAERFQITINRMTETYGIFRHTKSEILDWVALCKDYGCELVMSHGPRASYDTSASFQSPQGQSISYRLRGQEQLIRAIEDIKRGFELGVRSFLIYDEGLLWLLSEMRKSNEFPREVKFKMSAHCGYSNSASILLLERLGADSVNPVRDLQLPILAAIRKAITIPLDCHTDNPKASGGFIRTYEVPEIVKTVAPVYLKIGNSNLPAHGTVPSKGDISRMVAQISIVLEILTRHCPEAIQSQKLECLT